MLCIPNFGVMGILIWGILLPWFTSCRPTRSAVETGEDSKVQAIQGDKTPKRESSGDQQVETSPPILPNVSVPKEVMIPANDLDITRAEYSLLCMQTKASIKGESESKIDCSIIDTASNKIVALDSQKFKVNWLVAKPVDLPDVQDPVITQAGTQASFNFKNNLANSVVGLERYFAMENSNYSAEVLDLKDPSKKKIFKANTAQVIGELCSGNDGSKIGFSFELSDFVERSQAASPITGVFDTLYNITDQKFLVIGTGTSFEVSGGSNNQMFVRNSATVRDTGSTGSVAVVINGGTYESVNSSPRLVFAEPKAMIKGVPDQVLKKFIRTPLLCPSSP